MALTSLYKIFGAKKLSTNLIKINFWAESFFFYLKKPLGMSASLEGLSLLAKVLGLSDLSRSTVQTLIEEASTFVCQTKTIRTKVSTIIRTKVSMIIRTKVMKNILIDRRIFRFETLTFERWPTLKTSWNQEPSRNKGYFNTLT